MFGSAEEHIEEDGETGGIQAIDRIDLGQGGIGYSLGNVDYPRCQSADDISQEIALPRIFRQPVEDGNKGPGRGDQGGGGGAWVEEGLPEAAVESLGGGLRRQTTSELCIELRLNSFFVVCRVVPCSYNSCVPFDKPSPIRRGLQLNMSQSGRDSLLHFIYYNLLAIFSSPVQEVEKITRSTISIAVSISEPVERISKQLAGKSHRFLDISSFSEDYFAIFTVK